MVNHLLDALTIADLNALARQAPGIYLTILLINLLACQTMLARARRARHEGLPQARSLRLVGVLGHLINAGLGLYFAGVHLS